MVKDSRKYLATGGWGFGDFKDGKASDQALHEKCSRAIYRPKLATIVYQYPLILRSKTSIRNSAERAFLSVERGVHANKLLVHLCLGRVRA